MTGVNYACIGCRGSSLSLKNAEYSCPKCEARYPVYHGVPIFVRQVNVSVPLHDQVTAVLRHFGFSEDLRETMAAILAMRYEFPQQGYSAENNSVGTRIRAERRSHDALSYGPPQAAVVLDYLPDTLPAATVSTHNIRLLNTGSHAISSAGHYPVQISYHWYAADDSLIDWDGMRTRFPTDLQPGRAITVPVSISAPQGSGACRLQLDLVCESQGWGGLSWSKMITVGGRNFQAPDSWEISPASASYEKDHEAGRDLLGTWLSGLPHRKLRVLEIGGTAAPQTPVYGHEVWNVDIDVQSLQIGRLQYATYMPERKCTFLCADALDLPFSRGSFDCIALFATLHHFENPAAAIRYWADFLAPGGFLAVLCEPVGHNVADEQYLHELRAGINEQTFSLEEYDRIFRRAGVSVIDLRVDGGSLKARLFKQKQ